MDHTTLTPWEPPRSRDARPRLRTTRRRVALLCCLATTAAGSGACERIVDVPEETLPETCSTSTAPLCHNQSAVDDAREALADLLARVTLALENDAARMPLTASLGALTTAIGNKDLPKGRQALEQAIQAHASARSRDAAFPGDAPDLATIELALDRTAMLMP